MADLTYLTFPCEFPIKIIGNNNQEFIVEVTETIRKYFPNTKDASIQSKMSKLNQYLAITATVTAEDKATLDALYQALTKLPGIKMVL